MKKRLVLILFLINSMSAFAILDGSLDTNKNYQNVYKIRFFLGRFKKSEHCTATVISDYHILTAGHCTDILRPTKRSRIKFSLNGRIFKAAKFFYPEKYEKYKAAYYFHRQKMQELKVQIDKLEYNGEDPSHLKDKYNYHQLKKNQLEISRASDDAVIIKTTYRIPLDYLRTKLNFDKPKINQDVVSIGYGYQKVDESGFWTIIPSRPKYDFFKISSFKDNYILVHREQMDSSVQITTPGDSGGPLLLQESGEQIGILRGLNYIDDIGIPSMYTSLYGLKKFFSKVL